MKKICLVLFSVLMMLLVVGCGSSGPKKMVIGLDDNFAPMGFRNEKNEIVGFDIDLAREACKRAGMEVTFKPIDWSAKEAELNGKRIDAIWNCFTINPEREKVIQFSKPYINNCQVVAVPVASKIETLADLKGKAVGVQDDSTGSYLLDGKYADMRKGLKEYKKYPDFAAAFLDIDSGRLDALVVDEILVRYYMKKAPGKYKVLKFPCSGSVRTSPATRIKNNPSAAAGRSVLCYSCAWKMRRKRTAGYIYPEITTRPMVYATGLCFYHLFISEETPMYPARPHRPA